MPMPCSPKTWPVWPRSIIASMKAASADAAARCEQHVGQDFVADAGDGLVVEGVEGVQDLVDAQRRRDRGIGHPLQLRVAGHVGGDELFVGQRAESLGREVGEVARVDPVRVDADRFAVVRR